MGTGLPYSSGVNASSGMKKSNRIDYSKHFDFHLQLVDSKGRAVKAATVEISTSKDKITLMTDSSGKASDSFARPDDKTLTFKITTNEKSYLFVYKKVGAKTSGLKMTLELLESGLVRIKNDTLN